jgi:hypothetical protein
LTSGKKLQNLFCQFYGDIGNVYNTKAMEYYFNSLRIGWPMQWIFLFSGVRVNRYNKIFAAKGKNEP